MKLILASGSPRRIELLQRENVEFTVIKSDIDERSFSYSNAYETARGLAYQKAKSVYSKYGEAVLGADTIVFFDGKIIGKANNEEEAEKTLKMLSGKTHKVITGYFIFTKERTYSGHEESEVTFNDLSDDTIKRYIDSGLYKGKAGSYGVQDGFDLVKSVKGDVDNVIGLPVKKIVKILKEFNVL